MAVTAEMVKELRERTGAGMMDCKRALAETDGDAEKAIEILRERGLATAAKKAGRVASEGLVVAYVTPDAKVGALVEVNCETDFVARNEEFQEFTAQLASAVTGMDLATPVGEGAALMEKALGDSTVGQRLTDLIAKIGENMAVRRYARFAVAGAGRVEAYIHMGGRIGVLVEASASTDAVASSDAAKAALRDVAMQVAAARPEFVRREEVSADVVEREITIYRAQAANEGKPAQILDKIAQGKLEKFFKDICLVEQPFIKDTDRSVDAMLKEQAKQAGGELKITRFARFERGEGLAKRDEEA